MAAPVLTSVETGGTVAAPQIYLVYDDIDPAAAPSPGDFVVKLDGVTKTVSSVTMNASYVRLNMGAPLPAYYLTTPITVSYTDPGGASAIQNAGDEHAASLVDEPVTGTATENSDIAIPAHIYEGASGTVELPVLLGGRFETAETTVRVSVARTTIPAANMHAWLYVDGVAHTDVWGAMAASAFNDATEVSVTGLAPGAHTFDVLLVGADDITYEQAAFRWVASTGDASYLPVQVADTDTEDGQFLLENFTGANAAAVIGHTGELGATWTLSTQTTVSNGGSTNAHDLYQGALYRASTTVGQVNGYVYPSGNPGAPDFAYEIDVRLANTTASYSASNTCIEAYFCLDVGLNSSYFFRFGYTTVSGAVYLQLFQRIRVAGTATVFNVTAANVLVPHGDTHTLRFEVSEDDGWAVTMNGTAVDSGSDYIEPQAAENMLFKLQSSTAASGNHHVLIEAVRGFDAAVEAPFLGDGLDIVSFGEGNLVFVAEGLNALEFGQGAILLSGIRQRDGIDAVEFGQGSTPRTKGGRQSNGLRVVNFGAGRLLKPPPP